MMFLSKLYVIVVTTVLALAAINITQDVSEALTPPPIEGKGVVYETGHPGQNIMVEWTLVKRTECPGQAGRVWDGENNFHLAEVMRPTGISATYEETVYNIPTDIPEMIPPGHAGLKIKGYYQCEGEKKQNFTLGPVDIIIEENENG